MSVKHVLIPQVRYQALLNAEEKYLSARKQEPRVPPTEDPASIHDTVPSENSDVSLENVEIREQEEEPHRNVPQDGEGEGEVRANVKERELTSLRPPGIPAGPGAPLKKWMTWGNSAPKK